MRYSFAASTSRNGQTHLQHRQVFCPARRFENSEHPWNEIDWEMRVVSANLPQIKTGGIGIVSTH
jgi:hypothetical protein